MTSTATISRSDSPCWLDWNAWAVPANAVVTSEVSTARPAACTSVTASESPVPGLTSNDRVTAGSWPAWVTDSGPSPGVSFATDPIGTSEPFVERTCRSWSADASRWYCGRTSRMTQYWLFGVKMVETCRDP